MNYTVVIVTYNRLELLRECLECVDNQTLKFHSVVLVNNCSTDGTSEYLKEYCKNKKNIALINTDCNLGGSGGFELGVKNVPKDTDYVLLIDDDAMLDKKFLEEIDKHKEEEILAYSGTIRTENVIDTSHRRRLKNSILMTKSDVPVSEYEEESFLYDLSTFCGLVVNKKLIDKIGYPRGDYFIWYDDTEYSLRVLKHTNIKNVNSACINHKTKVSTDAKLNWKSYYGYRNQIDVGKRYSKVPLIYITYRYLFHRLKILQFYCLSMKHSNHKYYSECVKLHKTVLKDSKAGVTGLSEVYCPGYRLDY